MSSSCPISATKIDESSARVNSAIVACLSVWMIVFGNYEMAAFLFVDFVIKTINPRFIPLSKFSAMTASFAGLAKNKVDYAPKRFAASIGTLLLGLSAVSVYFGFESAACLLLVVVSICATLEALFAYCVGCKVYEALISLGLQKAQSCTI